MTEAVGQGEATGAGQSLFERRSAIDRLIDLPETLPGPMLAWLVGGALILVVAANIPIWLAGDRPIGTIDSNTIGPVAFTAYAIGLILSLNRVARSSYRQFLPVLGPAADDQPWLTRLTSVPTRTTLAAIAVLEVVVTVGYLSDPRAQAQLAALPGSIQVVPLLEWWVAIATLGVLVMHTLRKLRAVRDLNAAATSVDLFQPGPLTAFSGLTAATAIGIIVIAVPFSFPLEATFGLVSGAGFTLLAVASFVLPLNGLHDRMVAEKRRLLSASGERLRATVGRVHESVDEDDLSRADKLQSTMASLIAERDLLNRLSTWPWSPGIFRGFASALLLPIVIWLVIRVLERLV